MFENFPNRNDGHHYLFPADHEKTGEPGGFSRQFLRHYFNFLVAHPWALQAVFTTASKDCFPVGPVVPVPGCRQGQE
jgi:hypothetical protein